MRFQLRGRVDTDDPAAIRPLLEAIVRRHSGTLRDSAGGFEIEGKWDGSSARELNRDLLTELRRTVKRTRLRAEWSSSGAIERFFDYVPKGTRTPGSEPAGATASDRAT
jgi:hypothetical protein